MPDFEYDAFLSHASEDKATFVEPLAQELVKLGLGVWYDRFSLRVGDSLHDSIELGLSRSRYGVVVFSPAFFAKRWTRAELNGLFAREMDGHKVILPIWHELTRAEIVQALPIMADKVALQSSDGVSAVARSLVEVIKPELLTVKNSSDAAVLAGKRLAQAVDKKHPGYEIRVSTGTNISINDPGPKPPGVLATLLQSGTRTDILVSDPGKLEQPPQLKLSFTNVGLEKLKEGVRTGKAQRFLSGEFRFGGSSIPMMPSAESIDGGHLEMRSNIERVREQDVRLEVVTPTELIHIPVMKLQVLRAGVEEIEFRLHHTAQPFELRFVVGLKAGSEPQDFDLSTSFSAFDFTRIDRCVRFIDALMAGNEFRIFDLTTGLLLLGAGISPMPEWMPNGLIVLIGMVAAIERHFGVSIPWPNRISDADIEKIHILDCLISGEEFGTNLSLTAQCPKTGYLSQYADDWRRGPVTLFFEPTDADEVTPLFGVTLPVPPWGFYTEQVAPVDVEEAGRAVESASDGSMVAIPMHGLTPTYVRLKASLGPGPSSGE